MAKKGRLDMHIKEKILLDRQGLEQYGPINIVIFGDSVSHGALRDTIDYENVYWNVLKKKLNQFRDYMPVNMINASIGGTTAHSSLNRLESQALKHSPDLMIVCFGLNDVNGTLEAYINALKVIFEKSLAANSEVIFMTPNMLNTYVAEGTAEQHLDYAKITAQMQNEGKMDKYMQSAVALARDMGVSVCDCYQKWKEISKEQDITLLLANRINHPTREMHELFANALYAMIFDESDEK
jgi:lysophospholipase L1-like esterase